MQLLQKEGTESCCSGVKCGTYRRLSLDIVSQEDLAYWQDISPGFLTPGYVTHVQVLLGYCICPPCFTGTSLLSCTVDLHARNPNTEHLVPKLLWYMWLMGEYGKDHSSCEAARFVTG
jgi:hypothetical protein